MWSECRLVGLGIVGVVMGFRVNRILVTRVGTVCVVCVMMAIRVIDVFDRVLFSGRIVSFDSQNISLLSRNTHSRLVGQAITGWHGEMRLGPIWVVGELIAMFQWSPRGRSAIAVSSKMGGIQHGGGMVVPEWVCSRHC